MSSSGESVSVRDSDLTWRSVDDEVIVLDLATSTYFSVNGSGAVLWSSLVEGATPEALAAQLCAVYEIDEQTARTDVEAFLAMLRDRGLLG